MSTAIAIGSVIATKALEKTGEEVGETLFMKIQDFLSLLKKNSPDTVTAIETAIEKPIDYGKTVFEVNSFAQVNPELAQSIQELETFLENSPLLNLAETLKDIEESVKKSQYLYPDNFIQNIQKAINAAQTQTIDQRGSTFNI